MDILLATTNPGKLREFAALLEGLPFTVKNPADVGISVEVDETGDTFEANATQKALAWAKGSNMVCVADDSGLCVDALDGAPGVYSARWAAMHNVHGGDTDTMNRELVVNQLANHTNRAARYVCVAAIAWPDGRVQTARGELEGTIIDDPRGTNGFGYDPVFVPQGYDRTAAELDAEEKNAISHRGNALADLKTLLLSLADD
ncbi:RdgB/HAM1 family non-canonical purine NTP pyrophosphatase [Stomatohabitans albus]|uniref:RdgB/HAM1 family non-canonical purine NTP pyrophosphatase n=1 Tax=Stomatohabitans albus TaxID=3110766 RepID=UPI00300D0E21